MTEIKNEPQLSKELEALQRKVAELESLSAGLFRELDRQKHTFEQTAIFRKFAETSGQGFGMGRLDGVITWSNAALARILGHEKPEDVVGSLIPDYYRDDDREKLQNEILPKVIEQGMYTVEIPLVSISGRATPCSQAIFLIRDKNDEPLYFANVITDISERKRAEEDLRRAHESLEKRVKERTAELRQEIVERIRAQDALKDYYEFNEKIFSVSSFGLATYRADGQCVSSNQAMANILGATKEQVLKQNFHTIDYWRETGLLADAEEVLATGKEKQRDVYITTPFDKTVWVEARFSRFNSGGKAHLLLMINDITERKNAEKALRESEDNLAITLNSIGDAVIATNAEGRVTRMNPVAERLTGWPASEASDHPLEEVFCVVRADTRENIQNPVGKVLEKGDLASLTGDTMLVSRSGSEYKIATSGAPIIDNSGDICGLVFVFRDVTEEQALLEQLRHSQKMEAVGQLAGGVAHDFNNLLTAILGNAQLLIAELDPDCEQIDYAKDIVTASGRAADLTEQLLAFSRKGQMQTVDVDMHRIVNEVVELLRRSIDKRIEIVKDLEATSATVYGDPTQLENAVLNLGVNASDAMPDGGELTFSSRNVYLDEEYCRMHSDQIQPGHYVELDVTDTGIGMPPDLQDRIFEPFFTTKTIGRGTGLGLAGVYGCVTNHGGIVSVYSELSRGSTFRVFLRVAESAKSVVTAVSENELIRGEGHVLVVDDEEIVRTVISKTLHDLGYTVSLCPNGVDAVELFRKHHAEIDLVILDLVMPRMGGEQAYQKMTGIDPTVPVLIASGFSRSRTINDLLERGAVGFLKKPFRIEEVSRQVAANIKTREE